ncbi:MAG: hypothetical protein JWQ35_2533 [Bacteriovoracaceae bacterium]|nr:hypothetical protein [Bacteriovoracaceae bacterium]
MNNEQSPAKVLHFDDAIEILKHRKDSRPIDSSSALNIDSLPLKQIQQFMGPVAADVQAGVKQMKAKIMALDENIKEQPWKFMAISGGLGFVAGFILKRIRA